jgi:hypothetical protein
LPVDFRQRGDISVVGLLEECDYPRRHAEVTVEALERHLCTHPELIDEWLRFSADQRSTHSWYFLAPSDPFGAREGWAVGEFPGGPPHEFHDAVEACAFFIKQWADHVRS